MDMPKNLAAAGAYPAVLCTLVPQDMGKPGGPSAERRELPVQAAAAGAPASTNRVAVEARATARCSLAGASVAMAMAAAFNAVLGSCRLFSGGGG